MKYHKIGDHLVEYNFIFPETARYFSRFEATDKDVGGGQPLAVSTTLERINDTAANQDLVIEYYPAAEYDVLALETSTAMVPYGGILLHSVAFCYRGKAIVFTGPSGIGKTTQYAQWKRLFKEEVKVISGDMPVMSFREDGSIWMMPSPWNGKEKLHSNVTAPLGGVIVLDQKPDNTIARMKAEEAILPVYGQMCLDRSEEEQIRFALKMEDLLLRNIPIWKLSSRGDLSSAQLCHDTIMGEIYGE